MPRASVRLCFAIFALSFGLAASDLALAQSGARRSLPVPLARLPGHLAYPGVGHHVGFHRASPYFARHRTSFRHNHNPHRFWLGAWPYLDTIGEPAPMFVEQEAPPLPTRLPTGIPSVSDLPASTGIRSEPSAAPAIYLIGTGHRSLRRRGAKVMTMDEAGPGPKGQDEGPRIIHLNVPRGR